MAPTGTPATIVDKLHFNYLVDDLAELLVASHGVVAVIRHRKLAASMPAPGEAIADVKRQNIGGALPDDFAGEPWMVISPEHSEVLKRGGLNKADVSSS